MLRLYGSNPWLAFFVNRTGFSALTILDMAACKLLANSDRWADDGVFSRVLTDLAMIQPKLSLLRLPDYSGIGV